MMDLTRQTLEKRLEKYPEQQRNFILLAYEVADKCHKDKKRASGDSYIIHPLAVALNIMRFGFDASTIAAALLHDTIEDCGFKPETIQKTFGDNVRFLVEGVTKLKHIRYSAVQKRAESVRKMFLAVAEDIRVVIIKLYDRLHNMQTIQYIPKNKQQRIALETLELYAPLAYRLGIGELKGQLEDLAFPIVYPKEHAWLVQEIKERIPQRTQYLKHLIPIIKRELQKEEIEAPDIHIRAKHYYSLWRKLVKNDMDFGSIYDLAAVRIIVQSIEDCYTVLGIIHKIWKPLPGRIKDYIALPKPNGYQSLHTTVFAEDGKIVELQIRTHKMHEEAEFGIAAHWAYDEAGKSSLRAKATEQESTLIKQLQEWQHTFSDASGEEYLESLKIDFFKNRIFVLTPKGEVIDLPESATPIDFAYYIHTDIGNRMMGAKINGKLVPFSYELQSGDTVEILVQKNKKPSPDWLKLAKTSVARSKIRSSLKRAGIQLPKFQGLKKAPKEFLLEVQVKNRIGMLKDITSVFADAKINITVLHTKRDNADYPIIFFRCASPKKRTFNDALVEIQKIKGVINTKVTESKP